MANSSISFYLLFSSFFLVGALCFYRRLRKPIQLSYYHWLLMFAYGNLGMLLGWLADFGWLPLLREGVCLCGCANSPLGEGAFCHCPFMYLGMYLGSLPCLISIPCKGKWKFCPKTFFSCLGMGPGMMLGSYCMTFFPIYSPTSYFFLSVFAMLLGMSLGMWVFHQFLDAITSLKEDPHTLKS